MEIKPVTLEGQRIRLEPLTHDHQADLCRVGLNPDLWRLAVANIGTPEEMSQYIQAAINERDRGVALPFATIEKSTNRAVGSTRFGNIDIYNRHVEIGWTWIGKEWQRTVVNTEAKYLMLTHAFEKLGCIRVEFKTDSLNQRSRNAILRIGAAEEGTFRNHMIVQGGRFRHSVYFSIIDSEWPAVKERLEEKLNRR
jgi:N-acetyltransferase